MASARPLAAGAIILIVAGALRDTTVVGNSLFFREISQGIALFLSIAYLPQAVSRIPPRTLLLVMCYLAALVIGAVSASAWDFVLLQIGSLTAVILFALCWYSHASDRPADAYRVTFNTVFYVLSVVVIGSLAAIVLAPELAYERVYSGELRFHGLLSRPGWMGAFAGLLAGIAMLHHQVRFSLRCIAGLAGLACLILAGARTYWVAFAVATAVSWMVYRSSLWRKARFAVAAAVFVVGGLIWNGLDQFIDPIKGAVRSETVANLTGRTSLWTNALEAFGARPWFGYGLTQGSVALEARESGLLAFSSNRADPRAASRTTLHNGYIQSVLDSGLVGAFFYIVLIIAATLRLLKQDKARQYAPVFYCIIFLAVGNMAENVIYAASVFPSVLFWLIAMFALCLRPSEVTGKATHAPDPLPQRDARRPRL